MLPKMIRPTVDECAGKLGADTQLNEYMLCKGAAWYYKRYEASYSPENKKRWTQAFAKAQKSFIGIWRAQGVAPIPPSEWRQGHEPVPVPCP